MGILDRIAGTLDELTGEADATIAAEVERARALAGQGDTPGAEALLAEITRHAPRAPLPFLALGQLLAQRGDSGSGGGRVRARGRFSRAATPKPGWSWGRRWRVSDGPSLRPMRSGER